MSDHVRRNAQQIHNERGSGTVLALAVVAVLVAVAMVSLVIVSWVGCVHRARSAADLSAIAGAQAYQSGRMACETAATTARSNGAELTSCRVLPGEGQFIVEVTVSGPLRPAIGGGPKAVVEKARAGVVRG
jgi:secretion/DNA translocation related TadE-like protein